MQAIFFSRGGRLGGRGWSVRGGHPGFAFEFKAPGERPTAEQSEWLRWFDQQGWRTGIFYDAESAWAAVKEYYAMKDIIE